MSTTHSPDTRPPSSYSDWLLSKTKWVEDKPWLVCLILGILGLLVRQSWLNLQPLVSGDQGWATITRLKTFGPWPTIWDPTDGLGGLNGLFNDFRFPMYAVEGILANLGAHWNVIQRVVLYFPEAILAPISSWLLAREILGKTRWTLLSPLLFVASTYMITEGNGEIPLALGAAVGCLVLVAFLKMVRQRSVPWAIATGLLMAVCATSDIRPAYVTALILIIYLPVLFAAEPKGRLILARLGLASIAGVTFLLTQTFWILPTLAYGNLSGLPIPSQPDFNIITLIHGITGVIPEWTGANPTPLVQGTLNPLFILLPMVALIALTSRKLKPEYLWLAIVAVVFGFLAKTNNAPLGSLYDWLFMHLPGFNLFREGSKFQYPVVMAFSILIPASLMTLSTWRKRPSKRSRVGIPIAITAILGLTVLMSAASIISLESGALLGTTVPIAEPSSFVSLTQMLNHDSKPGQVLWFGAPRFYTATGESHGYNIASKTHPIYTLNGNINSIQVIARDPLQSFCRVYSQPYCYVTSSIFPYLVAQTNTTYLVSPAGLGIWSLPGGLTNQWLEKQVSSMFGQPMTLGTGATAIYVWHIPTKAQPVTNYLAVGEVDSGTWSLPSILPAVQALNIPPAFRQIYAENNLPVAPAGLPSSISISPLTSGTCTVGRSGEYAMMMKSALSSTQISSGSGVLALSRLASSVRAPGWSFYGPVKLSAGKNEVAAIGSNVTQGPCVLWSSLTRRVLSSSGASSSYPTSAFNSEQLTSHFTGTVGPWTQLNVGYDSGWRMRGSKIALPGEALFNLFYTPTGSTSSTASFTFKTLGSEKIGFLVSSISSLIALALLLWPRFRRRFKVPVDAQLPYFPESNLGASFASLGVVFFGLTTVAETYNWLGIPSRFPWASVTGNPYLLSTIFATMAIILVLLAGVVRIVPPLLGERLRSSVNSTLRINKPQAVAAAVLAATLSACTLGSSGNINQVLVQAAQAGATSPKIMGSSIQAARLSFVANNPTSCIADYTSALSTYPQLPSIFTGRANCYESRGVQMADAALQDYLASQKLMPFNPDVYYRLAAAYRLVGNVKMSRNSYLKLASMPNASAQLVSNAVQGLISLKFMADAQAALRIQFERFPNNPISFMAASDLAAAENQDVKAQAYIIQAENAAPSFSLAAGQAAGAECRFLLARLEFNRALTYCKVALVSQQNQSALWDDISAIYATQGHLGQAISAMNSAIGSFEANIGPYAQQSGISGFGLSNLYEEQGRLYVEVYNSKAAVADFEKAISFLPPNSPDSLAQYKNDIIAAENSSGI